MENKITKKYAVSLISDSGIYITLYGLKCKHSVTNMDDVCSSYNECLFSPKLVIITIFQYIIIFQNKKKCDYVNIYNLTVSIGSL